MYLSVNWGTLDHTSSVHLNIYSEEQLIIIIITLAGADLGGPRGPVPPFKIFLLIYYCYYKQHENLIIIPQELHT